MILNERKDYETLVVIKTIMNGFKQALNHFQENPREKEVSFSISKKDLENIKDRFPKEFVGFEVNVNISNPPQGLNIGAGAENRFLLDELVSSRIVVNIDISKKYRKDPYSFFQEFGTLFASELKSVVRHEIEHLGQKDEEKSYKDPSDVLNYYMSNDEVDAHLVQYHRLAKYHKMPFEDSLDYLFDSIQQAMHTHGVDPDDIEDNMNQIKEKYIQRAKERFPKFKQQMDMISEWKRHIKHI